MFSPDPQHLSVSGNDGMQHLMLMSYDGARNRDDGLCQGALRMGLNGFEWV